MKDPRVAKLADVLVGYSTHVQPGEKVLVEAYDIPDDVVTALVDRIAQAGGLPFVTVKRNSVLRALYQNASEEQMRLTGEFEKTRMAEMDAYIGVRGAENSTELSDVPDDRMKLQRSLWWNPVHSQTRVPHTKWVVLRWPTPSMAQQAGMSTEAFEDFYFDVCTFDYAKLDPVIAPLKELMDRTDRVRLTGPGTDLTFSIKDIPTIPCTGNANIPDGEFFTAPVRDSVNGTIAFNTPTIYQGTVFEGVTLHFELGKIVHATSVGGTEAMLNQILDSDEGARYIGEFSLGFNPYVMQPMKDILFDEKIAGSFHFTPGGAYDQAFNGNRSTVHWDMVFIQRPEFGGGEVYFDDVLIRKDGLFVPEDLLPLNPENLKALGQPRGKRKSVEQPVLETPRLLLRPFTMADAPEVQRLAGAPEVADTTLNLPHPYGAGVAEAWIGGHAARFAAGDGVNYAITLRADGALAGSVSLLVTRRHRRAELGYWLGVPFWSRGYMTEAAGALVEHGFSLLDLHKIEATHMARNPASGRVMEKIGMAREGLLRGHVWKNGTFEDLVVYGLVSGGVSALPGPAA